MPSLGSIGFFLDWPYLLNLTIGYNTPTYLDPTKPIEIYFCYSYNPDTNPLYAIPHFIFMDGVESSTYNGISGWVAKNGPTRVYSNGIFTLPRLYDNVPYYGSSIAGSDLTSYGHTLQLDKQWVGTTEDGEKTASIPTFIIGYHT